MPLLMAFDPGEASGVFLGEYSDSAPLRPVDHMIVGDGPYGLDHLLQHFPVNTVDTIVSEVFHPNLNDPGARETVSPRGEGILIHHFGRRVHWQQRSEKAMGFSVQTDSDLLLQHLGWWKTGTELGHTDGRDANDASIHALQFLRKQRHRPTLRMITESARSMRE